MTYFRKYSYLYLSEQLTYNMRRKSKQRSYNYDIYTLELGDELHKINKVSTMINNITTTHKMSYNEDFKY